MTALLLLPSNVKWLPVSPLLLPTSPQIFLFPFASMFLRPLKHIKHPVSDCSTVTCKKVQIENRIKHRNLLQFTVKNIYFAHIWNIQPLTVLGQMYQPPPQVSAIGPAINVPLSFPLTKVAHITLTRDVPSSTKWPKYQTVESSTSKRCVSFHCGMCVNWMLNENCNFNHCRKSQ